MIDTTGALAATVAIAVALAAVLVAVLTIVLPPATPFDPTVGCREWTDGCVICSRKPAGTACSTPGIACTRGTLQCLKRL